MKKFEVGAYITHIGTHEAVYHIEKITEKTVTVTIHKGGKYEKTKRCKIVDNGNSQYCEAFGMFFNSDDDKYNF